MSNQKRFKIEDGKFIQYLVRDTKLPNHEFYFPQFVPQIFLSLNKHLKKKTNFKFGGQQMWKKNCLMSLFSFSTAQIEKPPLKKLGKTRFVVWWFDVTNRIQVTFHLKVLDIVSPIPKFHNFFLLIFSIFEPNRMDF